MKRSRALRLSLPIFFLLGAQCGDVPTGPDPQPEPEPERAPRAPASLTAAPATAGRIDLAWENVAGETSFRIEWTGSDGNLWLTLHNSPADSTRYKHTGLRSGSTNTYRVQACNHVGCSAFSAHATATVSSPAAPDGLTASAVTSGRIDLTWKDNSQDESGFEVEYRSGTGTMWSRLTTTAPNAIGLAHLELDAGDTYTYRVRACADAGCSAYTAEATATVLAPAAPSDLVAKPVGSGRIDLAWKDNSGDETGFQVEYRSGTGTMWSRLTTTPPNAIGLAHLELDAGDTYTYRVRACADAGCSAYSAEATATVLAPAAPSDLVAKPVGSGRIDLTWKDNSGDETGFRVEYRSGSSAYWYDLATTPANAAAYSHTGLDALDTYAYRVRSCNASGCSAPTPEAQATAAAPVAPTGLAAVPVRSGRVNLTWQDNSADETSFRIEYREAPSSYWWELTSTPSNATSYAHTGLYAGTTYTYRVRSCNDSGCSSAGAEAQAKVLGPAAPTALLASIPGSGRISLAWQDNSADETSFQLQYRSATGSYWGVLRNLAPDTRSFLHAELKARESYVYRVRACNASGCSEDSNEVRATVTGPAAPSSLAATGIVGAISISWKDNSSDEDYFELQGRSAASSYWSLSSTRPAGTTSHTHSGLTAGDAYVYRIRSCNISGCSDFSAETGATAGGSAPPPPPGSMPGAPSLILPFSGAQYHTREPTFTWTPVSGATAYRLMVAPAGVSLPTDKESGACSGCAINQDVSGSSLTYRARLAPLSQYRWQVKARTAFGWTGWSAVYQLTTAAVYCPAGWETIEMRRAAVVCQNENAPEDYVVQVDLKRGGQIRSLQERRGNEFPDDLSPEFARKEIDEWWEVSNSQQNRMCVLNGAMYMGWEGDPFLDLRYRVPLSYPLREDGGLLTVGSERRSDQNLGVFMIGGQSATIKAYTPGNDKTVATVEQTIAGSRMAIVAFRNDYGSDTIDNQTFVAVKDGDGDDQREVVIFYLSSSARASRVRQELNSSFAVPDTSSSIVRLDGGGSSQLLCGDDTHVEGDSRTIPQAFGVYSEGK